MATQNTTEKYIKKVTEVHKGRYTYDNLVYVKSSIKVIVTCKVHGDFLKNAGDHMQGSGCMQCRNEATTLRQTSTTEDFIRDAVAAKGKRYDYSQVVYKKSNTPVNIICKIHGLFPQRPFDHVAGQECPKCAIEKQTKDKRYTKETFSIVASKVKNNFYDYSQVVYEDSKIPVKIICPVHGAFMQRPANHLAVSGCPACADCGFRKDKPASLYVLRSDTVVKVGITNRKVSARLKELRKRSGIDFKIVSDFIFTDGSIPQKLEKQVLSFMRSKYTSPTDSFDGSTECFLCTDTSALMSYLIPLTIH